MMDDKPDRTPQQEGASASGWRQEDAVAHSEEDTHQPATDEPLVDPFFYLPPAFDVTRGDTQFMSPKFYTFITWRGQTRYLPKDYEAYKDVWDAWEQSESPSGPQVWEAYSAYLATPKEAEPPEHEVPEQ